MEDYVKRQRKRLAANQSAPN
jgi:hypothetical protein